MSLLERLHYKPFRLFGYSLIMCEYMKGKLKLQLRHFSSFQLHAIAQNNAKNINPATTHSPKSSVMRQLLQKILEAAQWIQSCPEGVFQKRFFII